MKYKGRKIVGLALALSMMITGCTSNQAETKAEDTVSLDVIIERAKTEGKVVSVGMPDDWANWKDTWADLSSEYGLAHSDTDMSSAEEIAKMVAEKDNPTVDIGDVGIAFGPVAVESGVTQPYKTSYWDEIPAWAKDEEGHWMLAYTGTIAFITNTNLVDTSPTSWADLLNGDYKVSVGDVGKAAQASNAVLACAIANGGDETNLEPALAFFESLAKQGRISTVAPSVANLESGEIEVAIMWDFNALNYRAQLGESDYAVVIPQEGSVISGYTTIINKYAPNPNAAKLTREYIFSDAGQINLANGFARPIRSSIDMPDEVKSKMLPESQYVNAKPVQDHEAWNATTETLPELWQMRVLIHLK
ncbi:MAG: extracellular solute-binding protein [Clostridia bacterium]|nr:extracellular solute-binding protein [Clostridia bacterium]